jgi:hypothetical protein
MDASSVTLTDTLPPELIFVSSTPGSPDCVNAADTLVCDLGTLATTTSTQVVIEVVLDYPVYGSVSNTVGVSANENDPIPTNDTASETTAIGLFSDGFENSDTAAWSSTVP